MTLASIALLSSLLISADARNVRLLTKVTGTHADSAATEDADVIDQEHRDLVTCGDGATSVNAWHPNYAAGWTNGFCHFHKDCNSPSFATELACCKGAYAGQTSGHCVSRLPNPPTTSPTATGGLDVYYPLYEVSNWAGGHCTNLRPLPSGRPTYATMLDCCKGAYAGQTSGFCLSKLPSPPTTAPTGAGGVGALWYPEYEKSWAEAGCSNKTPLPFTAGGRPTFATQLTCCKGAYAGQASGKCLSLLPSPPTTSPTAAGNLGALWYPEYEKSWAEAGCSNQLPFPFGPGGRPTYDTQLTCCKGAYAGQLSGKCLSGLPSPPTTSPTAAGNLGALWYPEYEKSWAEAGCTNQLPLPFGPGGRPTFATQLTCCKGAYAGQTSGKCLSGLPSPPTTSPTAAGNLGALWYPEYETTYNEAGCSNNLPLPFGAGGRPTYDTQLACCKGAYAGQASGKCLSGLPSPPTTSPTASGGLDVFYPSRVSNYAEGTCINARPLPSSVPTFSSKVACCTSSYSSQFDLTCMCDAVGLCHSCKCHTGTEAQRNVTLATCPALTCS